MAVGATTRTGHHDGMITSLASATRVVLLPTAIRADTPASPVVRRYRLARVREDARPRAERHAHLHRSHD